MNATSPPILHGPTHFFFDDPNVDRLFAMVTALGAEISKVDDKLDSVLRVLERARLVTADEVAAFEPSAEQQAARDVVRQAFLQNLLGPFLQEADALCARAASRASASTP